MRAFEVRFAHWLLKHRRRAWVFFIAVTVFFAAGLPRMELRTTFSGLLPQDDPFVQTYQAHSNFGNPLTVTLMIRRQHGDIYNADTLRKIWQLTRDLDLTPGVDHDLVLSLASSRARCSEATDQVGAEHEHFVVRLGTGTIALQQAVNLVVDRLHWIMTGLLNLPMFALSAWAYRSPMAGLLLIVPVNLSNQIMNAAMHLLGVGLDVNSQIVAAIGVGVGIATVSICCPAYAKNIRCTMPIGGARSPRRCAPPHHDRWHPALVCPCQL